MPVVRLGQEIIASRFDRPHTVGRIVKRSNENHRNSRGPRVALDAATHLEACRAVVDAEVTSRHGHVEDAEIGMLLERGGYSRRTIYGGDRVVTQTVQLVQQ